jgi:hypothetical protein
MVILMMVMCMALLAAVGLMAVMYVLALILFCRDVGTMSMMI